MENGVVSEEGTVKSKFNKSPSNKKSKLEATEPSALNDTYSLDADGHRTLHERIKQDTNTIFKINA